MHDLENEVRGAVVQTHAWLRECESDENPSHSVNWSVNRTVCISAATDRISDSVATDRISDSVALQPLTALVTV